MDYLDEIAREQRNQIEAVEKGFDPFYLSPDIEKAKKAQIGEVREWSDGKYRRTATGWEYIKGSDPNIKSKSEGGELGKSGIDFLKKHEKGLMEGDVFRWVYPPHDTLGATLNIFASNKGLSVEDAFKLEKMGVLKLSKENSPRGNVNVIKIDKGKFLKALKSVAKEILKKEKKIPEKKEETAADAFPKMQEHLNKLNLSFVQLPRDLDSSGKWGEEKSFIVEPKNAGSLQVIYEKITGTSKWARDGSGNIYGNIHFRWNHVGGASNGYSVKLKFDKSGNLLKTTRG